MTLEDLVEEVVGEIFDEYDTESANEGLATDGGLVDGRLNFQDFEEATGIRLPTSASDTVAGFVIETLGRLPAVGDVVEVDGARIQVAGLDRRRISELLVIPPAARRLPLRRLPTPDRRSGGRVPPADTAGSGARRGFRRVECMSIAAVIVVLLILWAVLAVVGFVIEGLFWLAVIGLVLFAATVVWAWLKRKTRA